MLQQACWRSVRHPVLLCCWRAVLASGAHGTVPLEWIPSLGVSLAFYVDGLALLIAFLQWCSSVSSPARSSAVVDIPMVTQDEGYLPAYVAAAGLTRTDPSAVSRPLAVVVHHGTALVAAPLYSAVVAGLSFVLPTAISLNGVPLIPHTIGAVGISAFIYYFFARIAMPRFGGSLGDDADESV